MERIAGSKGWKGWKDDGIVPSEVCQRFMVVRGKKERERGGREKRKGRGTERINLATENAGCDGERSTGYDGPLMLLPPLSRASP